VSGTKRIDRGRSHSYLLDGEKVISVTTAISQGYPKPALVGGASKVAAECVRDEWRVLAAMEPEGRFDYVKGAAPRKWYGAAVRGTDVHKLAQRLAAGEEVDVVDEYVGHVDAYLRFVEEWRPRELLVEAPVFSRTYQYGGTLDLIADLGDDQRWLLDWKTSKSEPWPEAALQLAAYRYADFALVDDEEVLLADYRIERTGIVWLRADGYDLIEINGNAEAFAAFGNAQRLAAFRAEPRERWVGSMLTPPELELEANG
jgi:hypothetical protein